MTNRCRYSYKVLLHKVDYQILFNLERNSVSKSQHNLINWRVPYENQKTG
jgi:hypothetical protein